MNKAQDIKVIASRMRIVLRQTEGMPMEAIFWEDLKILLNLILEVGVNISVDIKTIAERLNRMLKVGDQALIHGILWDDIDTLLNLILEEGKDE
jgi:hypothetical protein